MKQFGVNQCSMLTQIVLKPVELLTDAEVDDLVFILNSDNELRKWLYTDEVSTLTRQEYRQLGRAWQEKNNAQTFCIMAGQPVGEISLGHITGESAQVGYWLASAVWNQGIGSQALGMVLEHARSSGIRHVSATIPQEDSASIKIWQKFGATRNWLENGKIVVHLDL